jgi:Golgi-body localisation protein domain/RNA pol II promoter Fmp27 protein domain
MKVLKHKHLPKNIQPCLAEIAFGINLDGSFDSSKNVSFDKLQVELNNTKLTIFGGFYEFVKVYNLKRSDSKILYQTEDIVATSDDTDDLYKKIAKWSYLIPKAFSLTVQDVNLAIVRENTSRAHDYLAIIRSIILKWKIQFAYDEFKVSSTSISWDLSNLTIDTMNDRNLELEQHSIDFKLNNQVANVYTKLKSFKVVYNHGNIIDWIKKNLNSHEKFVKKPVQKLPRKSNFSLASLKNLFGDCTLKICIEWWDISMICQLLNNHAASINLAHTKLLLNESEDSQKPNWMNEILIESLCFYLDSNLKNISGNNLKKTHIRGSVFYIGVLFTKISNYSSYKKIEATAHTLRTEYSKSLASFLIEAVNCAQEYKTLKANKVNDKSSEKSHNLKKILGEKLITNIKVTDITTFFINQHDMCSYVNLPEISINLSPEKKSVVIQRMQVSFVDFSKNLAINNVSEHSKTFIATKLVRLEHSKEDNTLLLYVVNNIEVSWSANFHMHLFTLKTEIQELNSTVMSMLKIETSNVTKEKATSSLPKVELHIKEQFTFQIKISSRHSMSGKILNIYASSKKGPQMSVKNVQIAIDSMKMFELDEIYVNGLNELKVLTEERKNYENFKLAQNKVWAVKIGSCKGIFPYDHDFSSAIKDEFVSIYKWLKILHNYKKSAFTENSPLPRDLFIQINEFLLEMSDDPFEVKLRDNYVLLLDEYNESLKRKKTLDQKINELRSQRLILPAGYVEELNQKLITKNSEIYIERSKKLYEASPRTRLFAWIMTDLKLYFMADPSIHGYNNVTRNMRIIDEDSPWPEETIEFVTLWCRAINWSCNEWKFMLRDYPQPMFYVTNASMFGLLCGAEQLAPKRAKRDVVVEIGAPFEDYTVQRGMMSLKFYHDFDWEMDYLCYAFGPCWEPVIAQCNLSIEKILAPSKDPSLPLPFWDKMRLLFHGRLTIIAKQYTILLHASLDPYNTTEEMELTWSNCGIVWANTKFMFKGDLQVWVRTASRYDDCRLIHLPNLKLVFKLNWICNGNPNDHHSVIPCAPDKLPEYSSNQVHDSYRAFRSQNVNISITFETKNNQKEELPKLDLYGSTLRWFESLKLILSGITRPTRRGTVFNNVRPPKKPLSRHYKKAHLSLSFHSFQVSYWMSHALHRGFQLNGGRISYSSEHILSLNPIDDDGLIHRPKAEWSILYMNCELNDAEIWLRSVEMSGEKNDSSSESISNISRDICRDYFLSVEKVSYGREAMVNIDERRHKETPTHKLVVYDLKGAWTKNNRDIAFGLFDSFWKSQKLKANLSTEALKGIIKEGAKNASEMAAATMSAKTTINNKTKPQQQTSHSISMLQKLVSESDHKFVVFSDDLSSEQTTEQQLKGLKACQDNDIVHHNWFISLVNSQVLLKGCETNGYVILSAAKAEILQRVHRPVWRDSAVVSKTTWVGSLECMQYYATVNDEEATEMEKIMWLTLDNIIQENDLKNSSLGTDFSSIPHLVANLGSGQSVGGVVSVNSELTDKSTSQLQRIVSRCKCEFFYVSYGETTVDNMTEVPALPPPEETLSPWEKQNEPIDAFTLMHHDLDVQTSSTQYSMILDIVNNLLLYVDPSRRERHENLMKKRFELKFLGLEDQKRPIQHLQTEILSLMSHLRILEKDIHFLAKARVDGIDSEELRQEYNEVQKQIKEEKEELSRKTDELEILLSCYKESQLNTSRNTMISNDKPISIVRCNEICFKHAQWRLVEDDGQIGIADLILSNFLYTKNSKSDESVEHLLELGYIRINNLIPTDVYKVILCPTELQRDMPIDHKRVLRVFCREKLPVGGISVKEHFEVNVVPITIAITKKFYSTMLKFCFPDRDTTAYVEEIDGKPSKKSKSKKHEKKDSSFYVKIAKDDAEIVSNLKYSLTSICDTDFLHASN